MLYLWKAIKGKRYKSKRSLSYNRKFRGSAHQDCNLKLKLNLKNLKIPVIHVFKMIGKKVFGKTGKEAAKTATKKALQTAVTKTCKYAGKKAGDKIIQLLTKKNKTQ